MAAAGTHEITELTELALSCPAERRSPGRARRLIGCELRRWGHHEALVDDAVLVVSELASNAVIHAGSPFTVSIQSRDSLLRIAVRDAAPVSASNGGRGLLVRAPHGLAVVQALADQWGVEPDGDGDGDGDGIGKIVWAELRVA